MKLSERVRRVVCAAQVWRWVFALYAATLFVGTHWPNLKLDVPGVERPDLIVHLTIFGGWLGLLWLSGLVGPALKFKSLGLCVLVAVVYAAVDEGLQAIPWVRRNAALDDYAANCLGVLLGAALAGVVILWVGGMQANRERA